jgi:hypothetical protein
MGQAGGHRHADLRKELLLPGGCAQAEQTHVSLGGIGKGMRCVGRDVQGFSPMHRRLLPTEDGFDLTFQEHESLPEIVPVRGRPAARWNVHADQAVATDGFVAGKQDRSQVVNLGSGSGWTSLRLVPRLDFARRS